VNQLENKTAVITGAASGMGLAFARRFAKAGMKIVLADIEGPVLDVAVAELVDGGAEAIGVVTDVADIESVQALADTAIEAFGRVHLVCNNAGVGGGSLGAPTGASLDLPDWKWVLDVNLWGVIHGHSVFLPHLIEHGDGHIVNTASMAGHFPGHSAYTASKWAVVGITEGLLHNLRGSGSTVGVSCLCPGWVDTNIADSTRNRPEWAAPDPLADVPEEIAAASEARAAFIRDVLASGMPPSEVADLVHDAVVNNTFWIFTDLTMVASLQDRFDSILENRNPGQWDLGQALSQTN
jgi:NAD(P)-dependent dehydrogenase (short-subunit alcohol dehydrogenase family)